jgi:hypothetical protein
VHIVHILRAEQFVNREYFWSTVVR